LPYIGFKKGENGKLERCPRPRREMGPGCGGNGRICSSMGCGSLVESERSRIFKDFWSIDKQNKDRFICLRVHVKKFEKETGEMSRNTSQYTMEIGGKSIRVCAKMFNDTLGISRTHAMRTLAAKPKNGKITIVNPPQVEASKNIPEDGSDVAILPQKKRKIH
jgi:hypothetical protein